MAVLQRHITLDSRQCKENQFPFSLKSINRTNGSHWNRNILTIMQWQNKQFERSSSYARQHIKAIASTAAFHFSNGNFSTKAICRKLVKLTQTFLTTVRTKNKILIDKTEHQPVFDGKRERKHHVSASQNNEWMQSVPHRNRSIYTWNGNNYLFGIVIVHSIIHIWWFYFEPNLSQHNIKTIQLQCACSILHKHIY